jgi:hypothetical protein
MWPGLFVAVAFAACSHGPWPSLPSNRWTAKSTVVQSGPAEWTITTTRTLGSYSADGTVITKTQPTNLTPVPHAAFAAARAWQAIATAARQRDPRVALLAVREGLDELGCDCNTEHRRSTRATHAIKEAEQSLLEGDLVPAVAAYGDALALRLLGYEWQFPSVNHGRYGWTMKRRY